MKMLNANWMLATSQLCRCCIGVTKRVQPYCRLAISTMQTMPMMSCVQRFELLACVALSAMVSSNVFQRVVARSYRVAAKSFADLPFKDPDDCVRDTLNPSDDEPAVPGA